MIDIRNTKIRIRNEEECKKVQLKLFRLGCKWRGGETGINYPETRALYIDRRKDITFSYEDDSDFTRDDGREITVAELIGIKETTEPRTKTIKLILIKGTNKPKPPIEERHYTAKGYQTIGNKPKSIKRDLEDYYNIKKVHFQIINKPLY